MTQDFTPELTTADSTRLDEASRPITYGSYNSPGVDRYSFYRRKGYTRTEALRYALAWCRNAVEQKTRRLAHDTGAENWR